MVHFLFKLWNRRRHLFSNPSVGLKFKESVNQDSIDPQLPALKKSNAGRTLWTSLDSSFPERWAEGRPEAALRANSLFRKRELVKRICPRVPTSRIIAFLLLEVGFLSNL